MKVKFTVVGGVGPCFRRDDHHPIQASIYLITEGRFPFNDFIHVLSIIDLTKQKSVSKIQLKVNVWCQEPTHYIGSHCKYHKNEQ